ncbi:hypothetical protein GCM10020254_78970 [Streptomyces goshikiensis]
MRWKRPSGGEVGEDVDLHGDGAAVVLGDVAGVPVGVLVTVVELVVDLDRTAGDYLPQVADVVEELGAVGPLAVRALAVPGGEVALGGLFQGDVPVEEQVVEGCFDTGAVHRGFLAS